MDSFGDMCGNGGIVLIMVFLTMILAIGLSSFPRVLLGRDSSRTQIARWMGGGG